MSVESAENRKEEKKLLRKQFFRRREKIKENLFNWPLSVPWMLRQSTFAFSLFQQREKIKITELHGTKENSP